METKTLQQTIKESLKAAMMAKDTVLLSVIRGLMSAFTNELVAKGRTPQSELSDEEVLAVIKRQVKQRKDAIEQYTTAGRTDLSDAEQAELVILEKYLPELMGEAQVMEVLEKIKASFESFDKKEMGKFMAEAMKELKGKADGMMVKTLVEKLFN